MLSFPNDYQPVDSLGQNLVSRLFTLNRFFDKLSTKWRQVKSSKMCYTAKLNLNLFDAGFGRNFSPSRKLYIISTIYHLCLSCTLFLREFLSLILLFVDCDPRHLASRTKATERKKQTLRLKNRNSWNSWKNSHIEIKKWKT